MRTKYRLRGLREKEKAIQNQERAGLSEIDETKCGSVRMGAFFTRKVNVFNDKNIIVIYVGFRLEKMSMDQTLAAHSSLTSARVSFMLNVWPRLCVP